MRLNGTSLTFGSGRMYDRRVSLLPLPERMTRNPSLHLRTVFTPVTRIMFGQTSLRNRRAKLGDEYDDWYDASGMMRPGVPKKPSIVFDEEAERATKEPLGVLMFLTTVLQFENAEQEKKKGKLLEVHSSTRIEARHSLRILPA